MAINFANFFFKFMKSQVEGIYIGLLPLGKRVFHWCDGV